MSLSIIRAALASSLPSTERLVLVAMAAYADRDGSSCYPSQVRIQEDTGLKTTAVRGAIRLLEARGVLVEVARHRHRQAEYRIAAGMIPKRSEPPADEESPTRGDGNREEYPTSGDGNEGDNRRHATDTHGDNRRVATDTTGLPASGDGNEPPYPARGDGNADGNRRVATDTEAGNRRLATLLPSRGDGCHIKDYQPLTSSQLASQLAARETSKDPAADRLIEAVASCPRWSVPDLWPTARGAEAFVAELRGEGWSDPDVLAMVAAFRDRYELERPRRGEQRPGMMTVRRFAPFWRSDSQGRPPGGGGRPSPMERESVLVPAGFVDPLVERG